MIRFALGDARLTVLDAGSLWLDGGAMFGVVPRVLWSRLTEPDEANRIHLAMNVLLVEDGEDRFLVDTGAGTRWDEKARKIYRLEVRTPEELLAPAGLRPEDIRFVVNTHLHFDHAGGNTVPGPGGEPAASFPNAVYVVQEAEWGNAVGRNERNRASYLPHTFEPLAREGRLRKVDGETKLAAAVTLRPAPGHTPGMQIVEVRGGGRTAAFLGDLIPTSNHVPYPYVMAYDQEPMVTLATRKRLVPRMIEEGWIVVFEHDPELRVAKLVEQDDRLRAIPAGIGG